MNVDQEGLRLQSLRKSTQLLALSLTMGIFRHSERRPDVFYRDEVEEFVLGGVKEILNYFDTHTPPISYSAIVMSTEMQANSMSRNGAETTPNE